MLSVFKERPSIVLEAQKAKFKPHFIIQILIFIGVFSYTSGNGYTLVCVWPGINF